jgi:hypothetical protein
MQSKASSSFWKSYRELPPAVQRQAIKQYRLWSKDPFHASLQFKRIGNKWSARISSNYRALGISDGSTVVWFWIGTHARYDTLIKR